MKKTVLVAILAIFTVIVMAPNAVALDTLPAGSLPELPIGSMDIFGSAIVTNKVHPLVQIEFNTPTGRRGVQNSGGVTSFTNYSHYQAFVENQLQLRISEIKSKFPDATPPFKMQATVDYDDVSIPYTGLIILGTNSVSLTNLQSSHFLSAMVVKGGVLPIYLPSLLGVEIKSSGPEYEYTWSYNSGDNVVTNQDDYFPLTSSKRGVLMLSMKHALGERRTRIKVTNIAQGSPVVTNEYTQDGGRLVNPTYTTSTNTPVVVLNWTRGSDSRFEASRDNTNWSSFMTFGWGSGSDQVVVHMSPQRKLFFFRGNSE